MTLERRLLTRALESIDEKIDFLVYQPGGVSVRPYKKYEFDAVVQLLNELTDIQRELRTIMDDLRDS